MRRIVVVSHVTLDGVMQAPGHPDEDRRGGFDRGGWARPYVDAALTDAIRDTVEAADALLLGRRTHEALAARRPGAPDDDPLGVAPAGKRVLVASRTLSAPPGDDAELLPGEAADALPALMREEGGDLVVLGSGELIRSLRDDLLIDEYRLAIHPVLLGTGRRLFPDDRSPRLLQLLSVRTTGTGVILARYGSGVY
jgi:dihydrofolate reductase